MKRLKWKQIGEAILEYTLEISSKQEIDFLCIQQSQNTETHSMKDTIAYPCFRQHCLPNENENMNIRYMENYIYTYIHIHASIHRGTESIYIFLDFKIFVINTLPPNYWDKKM